MKSLTFFLFLICISAISIAQHLVIGTYTQEGLSNGIYLYQFDQSTGKASKQAMIATDNPSFLAIDRTQQYLYSVNEENKGMLSAFKYDRKNGYLTFINSQPNNGSYPCYISIDPTGKWLFTANYGDGSLTVHPIQENGAIGSLHQFIQHKGSSINTKRQSASHVHCTYISANNQRLYVPDLGIDKVVVYPFDATTGLLDTTRKTQIESTPGGGPRHFVLMKNDSIGYLVEEMTGTVQVVNRNGNRHTIIQSANHLPKGQEGAGADIHISPDERFLYVSQRSNSTIQIFSIDQETGRIQFVKEQPTEGNFPRNFTIHPSGKFLLVANQKTNDITIFSRNLTTGLLSFTGERIAVGSPVCLLWLAE